MTSQLTNTLRGVGNTVNTTVKDGFQLASNLSKNAFDLHKSVVSGAGDTAGTAVAGVVKAASQATGAVFEPVACGLKVMEGLEKLGEGMDSINGLSMQAIEGVAASTKEAVKMAGKTPTFFDPDGDGIVQFSDTKNGFVLLGLEESNAKLAAYAIHSVFSYPTAESWIGLPNTELPVRIKNMDKTRWGKNWGSFERIDWVTEEDVQTVSSDIYCLRTRLATEKAVERISLQFFGLRERSSWKEYWSDAKTYFGTALLIFEWGTTWPFVLPIAPSPFADQLGTILRTVVLPTMFNNYESAKKVSGRQDAA